MLANLSIGKNEQRHTFGIDFQLHGVTCYRDLAKDKVINTSHRILVPFAHASFENLLSLKEQGRYNDIEELQIRDFAKAYPHSNDGKNYDGYWNLVNSNQKILIEATTESPISDEKIGKISASIIRNEPAVMVVFYLKESDLTKTKENKLKEISDKMEQHMGKYKEFPGRLYQKIQWISVEKLYEEKKKEKHLNKSEHELLVFLLDLPPVKVATTANIRRKNQNNNEKYTDQLVFDVYVEKY